jgi:ABC-type antimicrobial peptide transport system, ATPase component
VFQNFHLLPNLSAERNVEIPLIYRGLNAKTRRELSHDALKLVGLEDRMHHLPNQLSGGQQQRVAIARAIVGNPALILADEPTGALDSKTGCKIMELFTELNESRGITIVQVTHDEDIAQYGSRTLRLVDGEIVSDLRNR